MQVYELARCGELLEPLVRAAPEAAAPDWLAALTMNELRCARHQLLLRPVAPNSRFSCRCQQIASVCWRWTHSLVLIWERFAAGRVECARPTVQQHLVSARFLSWASRLDLADRHAAWGLAQLRDSLAPTPRFPWPYRFVAPHFRSSLPLAALQPTAAARRASYSDGLSFAILLAASSKLLLPHRTEKLQAAQRFRSQLP